MLWKGECNLVTEWYYLEHFDEYSESPLPYEVLPTGPRESAEQSSTLLKETLTTLPACVLS